MKRTSLAGGPTEIVVPVCLAGVAAFAVSAAAIGSSDLAARSALGGPLLLLALAVAAEHLPVPLFEHRMVSLAYVFEIAAAVLYGPAIAVAVAALTVAFASDSYLLRKPPVRVLFNMSSAGMAAGAAGLAAAALGGQEHLLIAVSAAAATFLTVNLTVTTAVIAAVTNDSFKRLVLATLRGVAVPFSLAVSVVPLFVLAWADSRLVALTAVIPLAGIGLHLLTLDRSRESMRLALTDPLTGLGNRRHFDERLRRELDRAEAGGGPLSLVVIDLNRLKGVNDRFGHEAGDRLLRDAAACLRQGGEAFRFGGDEFALLLPGTSRREAEQVVGAARLRLASVETEDGLSAGAAFGVATYPEVVRDALVRAADQAAYRDKPVG